VSPIPSRALAARVAGRLRVIALLALLLTQIPPALAASPAVTIAAPVELAAPARPARPMLAAAGVAASKTDAPLADTNGNGRADPGETLRYTVVVSNSSGADLPGVTFDDTLDPSATLVAGSLRVSPLAFSDSYSSDRDTPLAVGVPGLLENDTGMPAPAVTPRSVTTAAGGMATTSANGSFSYTPPPGYAGIDSFSYSADNSAGSDTGTVTLTVRAAPLATDDSYMVAPDTSRTVLAPGVLANDTGFPPPSVTPFTGSTTAGGTLNLAANGGFSYTPLAGFTGIDSFVYTAVNPAGSDTATVTLTVGITLLSQDDAGYVTLLDAPLSVLSGAGVLQNDTLGSSAAPLSVSLGVLPAGKQVTILFDVLIADPLPIGVGQVVNQGMVSGSGFASVLTDDPDLPGAADSTITFLGTRKIYLPLIIRGVVSPLPDLVVENISSAGGTISVTVRNDGSAPVVDAFWIDLYIGPDSAPVRVNQLWSDVGSRGATWGIDKGPPLAPGARLTVTLGDSFYRPLLSNPGGAVGVGTQLYAQVDSFNATSSNGAIFETHERDGGAYNNILGPVVAPCHGVNMSRCQD
jgi:uncharacterized repeat protein (TIGR01451 family)